MDNPALLNTPERCGKIAVLEALLTRFFDERAKVLLFSRSLHLLDLLERFMRTKGYRYLYPQKPPLPVFQGDIFLSVCLSVCLLLR